METIANILQNMIKMGMPQKEKKQPLIDANKVNFIRVAAGDPAQDAHSKGLEESFPQKLKLSNNLEIESCNYKAFIVDGFSMSPEDIDNRNVLLCENANWTIQNNFASGKFVIIEVDKGYYEFKGKKLRFRYKLRKTLFFVPAGWSDTKLIEESKKDNDDILLSANQKLLKEKLEETREYEAYKDSDLVLSTTYRNGSLRYSFHPIELVKYIGIYCAKQYKEKKWTAENV